PPAPADERPRDPGALPAAASGRDVEASPGSQEPLVVADARSPIAPGPSLRWGSLKFVAQLRQTYLLCEGPDGFYVVDQHAAAERVNFDKLRKQFRSRTIASQALLFPLVLAVSPAEAELVEERAEDFAALGLDLRLQGAELVALHSVPRLLARATPERLVRDLLVEIARSGRRAFSDAIDLAIATMACHASVRAGDPLSETEARSLLAALDLADFAGYCPHGRPVVAATTWSELERRVGRR
ncbi:MAG: DNA mismatch repair protein MutL, partial [Deltaproteobacteria bacterium]|nr:DNA mismatch repair protein MutL [Deltaproteobacteria bacterium]